MSGRRQGDKRGELVWVHETKMHDLTRDEMEALLVERERQISLGYLRWLDQWVPNEEDGTH